MSDCTLVWVIFCSIDQNSVPSNGISVTVALSTAEAKQWPPNREELRLVSCHLPEPRRKVAAAVSADAEGIKCRRTAETLRSST